MLFIDNMTKKSLLVVLLINFVNPRLVTTWPKLKMLSFLNYKNKLTIVNNNDNRINC